MTQTNVKGAFVLEGLRHGRYSLVVEHAFTDSIGLDVPPQIVDIGGDIAHVALALPSTTTIRRALCPAAVTDTSLGVLLGVVRNSDHSAAIGGRVVLAWSELSADRTSLTVNREERTATTTSDSLGIYRACGVPVGVDLEVQAQLGPRQSGVLTERIGEAGVLVRDFTLDSEGDTSAVASRAPGSTSFGKGVLTGSVTNARSEPVEGARVNLVGTPRTTDTDARGSFRFAGLPTGTQGFEVTALGYLPRRFRAEVTSDTRLGVVRLDRLAILLDSVRVVARRQYDVRLYPEFEGRLRHRAFGQFVTEEMIERRHPFLLSDMLRMMSGFTMHIDPDGTPIMESSRGITTFLGFSTNRSEKLSQAAAVGRSASAPAAGGSCIAVYVNGMLDSSGDVNRVVPNAVHGVEVYRASEAPAKYHSGSCGVVLIWSK